MDDMEIERRLLGSERVKGLLDGLFHLFIGLGYLIESLSANGRPPARSVTSLWVVPPWTTHLTPYCSPNSPCVKSMTAKCRR